MPTSNIEAVGFYDSKLFFKNVKVSPQREIKSYEIELFAQTSGQTIIDGRRYEIKKGLLLVAKPKQTRNSILHFKAYYAHVNASDATISSFLDQSPQFTRIMNFDACAAIFRAMINVQNSPDPAKCLLLKSKLYELVHLIYASKQNQYLQSARFSEPTFETIKKAASFLDDNFAQEVSLASLAAKANLSPIYFHKMFKRYLGKTPHQYLLEKRLAAAESLLISTNLPLAEIALKSGFSSQAYFNYSFKQKTQLTPLQFRQRQASQYQL